MSAGCDLLGLDIAAVGSSVGYDARLISPFMGEAQVGLLKHCVAAVCFISMSISLGFAWCRKGTATEKHKV